MPNQCKGKLTASNKFLLCRQISKIE